MMLPCLGLLRGTHTTTRASASPPARRLTSSSSLPPPRVSLATTRMVLIGCCSSYSVVGWAWVPAGVALASAGAAGRKGRGRAPGPPYWWAPPTTGGPWSKLTTGGGEDPCHSSVSAFHGF